MRRLLSFTNFLGLLVLLAGGAALWLTQPGGDTRTRNLPTDIDPGGPQEISLHFAKDTGDGLVVEKRTVGISPGEDRLARALEELIRGPQQQGAAALVPAGTPVPTVYLHEETALVDLPAAYARLNFDTARELHLVYGMASTLLEFKEVQQVRFLLEGRDAQSLGHLSLLDPFKRQGP